MYRMEERSVFMYQMRYIFIQYMHVQVGREECIHVPEEICTQIPREVIRYRLDFLISK